jgi:TRAP-type transport system small permease protein
MSLPIGIIVLLVLSLLAAAAMMWANRAELTGSALSRLWTFVEDYVGQVLLLIMLASAMIQVFVRYMLAGRLAVTWTEELALLAMVWATFWGAAAVHRSQEHIHLAIVFDLMPPRLQQLVTILGEVVLIAVLVPVVWYGFDNARWLDVMSTVSIGLPLSVFAYSVPVVLTLMIVHSLAHLVAHVRGLFDTRDAEAAPRL